jgi:hypothetical protein
MSNPVCKVCGQSGRGVQFCLTPKIGEFGDVCVNCEERVTESLEWLGFFDAKPADCDICESGQVYHGLTEVLPRRAGQLTS